MRRLREEKTAHPLSQIFNRYYWLQIGLIALSIIIGIGCSAWVVKGSLIYTALEQEMAHYWTRVEKNPNAELPDTKNLYGYRWHDQVPQRFAALNLQHGVHRIYIDGKERMTVYGVKNGQHVLLVFGESNVNKLVWMFGLAPLMLSLFVLYSFLWWSNRRAQRYFSPITRLANALEHIDWEHQRKGESPFASINVSSNLEAEHLKQALDKYHNVLIDFVKRERDFTGDVSHELRTPLTILKGNVQLLQTRYGQERALTRLHNTIADMELLVDTLLAIARNDIRRLSMETGLMSALIQNLIEELQEASDSKGIDIHFHSQVQDTPRPLYQAMIKMVLSNILRNALNYSQGSRIDIILQQNTVFIADNGIGIHLPEHLKDQELLALQPQIEAKGHGIGLQLVQKLCKQLQWRVELYDRQYFLSLHPHLGIENTTGLVVVLYWGSATSALTSEL